MFVCLTRVVGGSQKIEQVCEHRHFALWKGEDVFVENLLDRQKHEVTVLALLFYR